MTGIVVGKYHLSPRMCLNGRMAKPSHKVGGWQTPTAERFASNGGVRRPWRAVPANRTVQAYAGLHPQPSCDTSASHSIRGLTLDRIRARQSLRLSGTLGPGNARRFGECLLFTPLVPFCGQLVFFGFALIRVNSR
jgi:hypothetical protein